MNGQYFNPIPAPEFPSSIAGDAVARTSPGTRTSADTGEDLTRAVHTRRLRKCIAEGAHVVIQPGAVAHEKCQRCGL